MNRYTWINELESLLERFSHLGISPDIAGMSLGELWGVYCFLKRLAEGAT